jgi:hypothetical protein
MNSPNRSYCLAPNGSSLKTQNKVTAFRSNAFVSDILADEK